MTYVLLAAMLIEAIAFIAKEHADRQKVVKALVLIPGERPDYLKWLAVNKSWWEQIKENLKPIAWACLGAGLLWLIYQMF